MQAHFAELKNGQKLHYRIENQTSTTKKPILLIHGNFSTLGWWQQTINGLKDTGRKIVAVDLRGFGKSSYHNKCSRFADWAGDVVEFIHQLGLEKCVLVGWSFGGAVSQKVCDLQPGLVSKLILTCSVSHEGLPIINSEGKLCKTVQQIAKEPKFAGAISILNSNNKESMRGIFDLLLYKKMPNCPEQRKTELALDPFAQRCYPELLGALANSDINIDNIKVPTLLIHGTEDAVLPIQTIIGTAGKLGKLDIWQSHAHMIPIEDTPRYVAAIKKFIEFQQ